MPWPLIPPPAAPAHKAGAVIAATAIDVKIKVRFMFRFLTIEFGSGRASAAARISAFGVRTRGGRARTV
jgi:hypothetical protein